MKKLRISADLTLPADYATKTAAILAQRRKGKTYAASVIAEELVGAKQPFVALDPTGAWWGLRASADGQKDGLPVVILGGQHADLPLERTGGKLVADLVVEEPGYYVIDFSLFESGEAERQFAVDFAERLYRAKGQPGRDFPLHLFVDEADRFIPQQIRKGSNETSARLLGAFEAIVRRGGLRGLGTTLISQRAAVVNKNVLEMLDVLIVLRTVGPNDREAIDDYVRAHGTGEERRELLASLASLAIGEAWVWEPGAEPPLFRRVQIRQRRTFNSSATPKPGERRAEPRRLAAVDLDKYRARMAATIERAKADDPKALRARIAELERDMRASVKAQTVIDPSLVENLRSEGARAVRQAANREIAAVTAQAEAGRRRAAAAIDQALAQLKVAGDALREPIDVPEVPVEAAESPAYKIGGKPPSSRFSSASEAGKQEVRRFAPAPTARSAAPARQPSAAGAALSARSGEGRMLAILATYYPAGMPEGQWAALAGLKRSGGTWSTYKSRLRTAGYIEERGGTFHATESGIEAAGEVPAQPATVAEVLDTWAGKPGMRPVMPLVEAVIAYGAAMPRDKLAESCGLTASGGTFSTYLSRARTAGLIADASGGLVPGAAFDGLS